MSFVHEKCLIKWLTQQNVRVCELCKSPFMVTEIFCKPGEIIRKNFKYLFSDKRRLVMMGLYGLYLFLFGKRFIQLLRYFKDLLMQWFSNIFTPKQ